MKKLARLFMLLSLLCVVSHTFAQTALSVNDIKLQPGERTTVNISLQNDDNIQSMDFKIFLPECLTFAKENPKILSSVEEREMPEGNIQTNLIGEHQLNVVMFSMDGSFTPGNGPILTFDVIANENATETKNAKIEVKNICLVTPEVVSTYQDDFNSNVTIYRAYNISAASANEAMGAVSIVGGGEQVESGASVTVTATPVDGYEFVNWTAGETVKSTENPYTFTATENVALTANFKAKKYDVTFDVDGEKTTTSLDFGSVITAPENPTKEGYTFAGWNPAFVEGATVPVGGITYTATWTVNSYTITFDSNGGSAIEPMKQDYGTAITAPENPTREGYTFAGWDPEIPATMPAADMTVKAQWTINSYKVTFVDGETVLKEETLEYGSAITAPEAPTREGYTFGGWDPAFEEGTKVPASDITYAATWTVNSYTITFDSNGGSAIEAITQDYGSAITAPENPTREGYTFAGWEPEIPATMPAADMTVKAQWTINSYKVTFVDGETVLKEETLEYGSAITAPEAPTREGYTFGGWDPAFEDGAKVPASDITYAATWTVNSYTITFDSNDGSAVKVITQDYGTKITAPENPTREGYTFAGWEPEIPATMPAADMTVKAQWTINSYKVTFVDGETVLKEETLEYGSAITAPEAPTREGYTFGGWDPAFEEGAKVPASDITYAATWTVNSYTITFDSNDGSAVKVITQDYGTKITAPENPTREGYTFAGWEPEIPETMPAGDMTVKAQWTINSYKVTFKDGETVLKEETLEYGSVITAPEDPTRKDYIFVGWDPAFEEGTKVPAADVTYTAVWVANSYTITFDSNGGSAVEAITLAYGAEIIAPENPTREGYTFVGWDPELPETMPAENITVKAVWTLNMYNVIFMDGENTVQDELLEYGSPITAPEVTKEGYTFVGWYPVLEEGATVSTDIVYTALWVANSYTITFDSNGGSEVESITQDYGTEIVAPENPVREGYTFVGWAPKIPATMPASNIKVKAQWTINSYKVTFMDGETVVSEDIMEYGSAIVAPDAPEKEGYTFKGWNPEVDATVPAGNVVYNAIYDVNTYKLTYYVDGEIVLSLDVEYGATIEAFEPETGEGMKFDGWQEEVPETMPAHDVEIHGTVSIASGISAAIVANGGNPVDVYSINGRLVVKDADAKRLNALPKGIYIINGNKYMKNR